MKNCNSVENTILIIRKAWKNRNEIWRFQIFQETYKNILTYPSKRDISVHSPNHSKSYAEWRNRQSKVRDSSKDRYFDEWFSHTLEPSEKIDLSTKFESLIILFSWNHGEVQW